MSARTSRYTGINAWLAASARASSRFGVQRARPDLDALPAPNDCSLIWFLSSRAVAVPPRSLRRGRTPNVIRSLLDGLGFHAPLDLARLGPRLGGVDISDRMTGRCLLLSARRPDDGVLCQDRKEYLGLQVGKAWQRLHDRRE